MRCISGSRPSWQLRAENGGEWFDTCHLCLAQPRDAHSAQCPRRRGMSRSAIAGQLRAGEWIEGLHPDSPLVFEAIARVDNQLEACEYRLSEIRRQEAQFAGELHQLMVVSTRLQRGQCEARRAMVRAAREQFTEQQAEQQQPDEQAG